MKSNLDDKSMVVVKRVIGEVEFERIISKKNK